VEGFTKGQNVVVVEDLISTGNSSTSRWSFAPSRCQCERHGCYIHIWVCCFGRKF
jgi:orotate phosphoribosyltransferase